ncbi:MAG: DegV family protein [Clostridia bacterium]|nr:DegV family protein [Clostridia bacterium]
MNVKIIADSTCDLSPELIEKYDIHILPLHILLDDKEYEDGATITPDELYAWADEHRTTPKTSAVSIQTAIDVFDMYLKAGRDMVCFTISSQMSGTANVLRLAVQQLNEADRVHIVDSGSLSTGIGLQVIEAAILAEAGKTASEIVTEVEALRPLVRASFVVDTLTYLHRGGRCSGIAALAGTALKLHPQIGVVDGRMMPGKKYRGPINRVVMNYVKDMEENMKSARPDRVFITHSGCQDSIIRDVYDYLQNLGHFSEILITRAGCVVSSHCGPRTLGVLYIDQNA